MYFKVQPALMRKGINRFYVKCQISGVIEVSILNLLTLINIVIGENGHRGLLTASVSKRE